MCFHHRPDVRDRMAGTLSARRGEELTTGEIKALISSLAAMGVKHVSFHGGEPLIRKDFCDLVDFAAAGGLDTSTFTNATLITDEIAARLAGRLSDLGVSIHGGEQTHDAVTGIPGSYRRAMEGVGRLLRARGDAAAACPRVHLTCIPTGVNYEHLDEIVAVAVELGLPSAGIGAVTFTDEKAMRASCRALGADPPGAGHPFLGDSLVPAEVLRVDPAKYLASMARLRARAAAAGVAVAESPFSGEEEIAAYFSYPLAALGHHCNYPWYSSVVSAYGDVYPCIQFSFLGLKMGNIRDSAFPAIWRGAEYREFRRRFRRAGCYLPVCAKCCSVVEEAG
jgi:radical SAM protein with 4Fe4S-binding SPASM domain